MRLLPLGLPVLIVLVGCVISGSASVASRPVPPVKTRPVQDVPLATRVSPVPSGQTDGWPPSQRLKTKPPSEERILARENRGEEDEEHRGKAREVPRIVGKHFEAYGFHEDEIGGHHEHGMVTLDGINLCVLRTGNIYKNPAERAKAVARLLEESLHSGDPLFILGKNGPAPAIYSVSHHRGYPRLIVTVTKGDALGYSHRSDRPVSQTELGQWWLAWLEDLIAVLFLDKPPSHLPVKRAEEVLILLGERLRELSPEGPYTEAQVVTAVTALSDETRNFLQSVAFGAPGTSEEEQVPWDEEQHH